MALGALIIACTLALAVLDLCAGDVWLTPAGVVHALLDPSDPRGFIVRELRLGHVSGAIVVGLCLGMSGGITQSLLRNPLASPDIVGVTAGASCAAIIALLGAGGTFLVPTAVSASVPLAACLGGALAGAAVIVLGWSGGIDTRRVVLVGLGVNAGLTALSSWLLVRADLPDVAAATVWLTGSLSTTVVGTVQMAGIGALGCLLVSVLTARTLDLLRFDDITVRSLGVKVAWAQLLQATIAVILASLACAVAGPVAFVAFCAPQLACTLFRSPGPPVVGGGLLGALLMVTADLAARTVFPSPVPVGLVTSFCGAPALLWLLLRASGPARSYGSTS